MKEKVILSTFSAGFSELRINFAMLVSDRVWYSKSGEGGNVFEFLAHLPGCLCGFESDF